MKYCFRRWGIPDFQTGPCCYRCSEEPSESGNNLMYYFVFHVSTIFVLIRGICLHFMEQLRLCARALVDQRFAISVFRRHLGTVTFRDWTGGTTSTLKGYVPGRLPSKTFNTFFNIFIIFLLLRAAFQKQIAHLHMTCKSRIGYASRYTCSQGLGLRSLTTDEEGILLTQFYKIIIRTITTNKRMSDRKLRNISGSCSFLYGSEQMTLTLKLIYRM